MSSAATTTLVTYNPVSVTLEADIFELFALMSEHGIHHVPVVDADQHLLGIVSDLDLAHTIDCLVERGESRERPLVLRRITAGEIMVERVVTMAADAPPRQALHLLLAHPFHSVPVVADERLVGIVTSTDFLREASQSNRAICRQPISDICSTTRPRIEASSGVDAAWKLLTTWKSECLVVLDGGRPLGAVSQRQLRRLRLQRAVGQLDCQHATGEQNIADLLQSPLLLLTLNDNLAHAARLMYDHGRQALPVVDDFDRLLGSVTENDILRALTEV